MLIGGIQGNEPGGFLSADLYADRIDFFLVETNGRRYLLSNNETFELVKGEKIKIIDVLPSGLQGNQGN